MTKVTVDPNPTLKNSGSGSDQTTRIRNPAFECATWQVSEDYCHVWLSGSHLSCKLVDPDPQPDPDIFLSDPVFPKSQVRIRFFHDQILDRYFWQMGSGSCQAQPGSATLKSAYEHTGCTREWSTGGRLDFIVWKIQTNLVLRESDKKT